MEIAEVIKNISIIIACWSAIYGIDSWRREHRGKKQADLAEEVLSLFYEAKDAVAHIRSPMSYESEGTTRKQGENETPEQKKAYDQAYVALERLNLHIELLNKIHSLRYRFMAQFGKDAAKPFDDLRRIIHKIQVSSRMLAQLWARQHSRSRTEQQEEKYFKSIQKHEDVFWEGLEEDDPIKPRLNKCVEDIEKTCRDILTAKGTLYSILNMPILNRNKS